jgi:hypothetical protein
MVKIEAAFGELKKELANANARPRKETKKAPAQKRKRFFEPMLGR